MLGIIGSPGDDGIFIEGHSIGPRFQTIVEVGVGIAIIDPNPVGEKVPRQQIQGLRLSSDPGFIVDVD